MEEAITVTAKQILIVDDEEDIRGLIQTCLEVMGGWQVLTACSGNEGLAMAQTEHPDAILLDVMMPDMDGPTTFKQLQADPVTRNIPVILLTARGRFADEGLVTKMGVKGVIAKPFNPLKLADQVAAVLG